MCGISGVLAFDNSNFKVSAEFLLRMRETMAHRGPDGAGLWISPDRQVGLGHRRLSIIDLSEAASQPMCNREGSLQIVFNGELYNHAEIRRDLGKLGRQWKTDHSDTEVILHAFEEWGIECVERFRGMFAIALWDAKQRRLWLIRDPVGIKPLYYSIHHGRITFASEIKALLTDPDQPLAVNEEALFHYLSFLSTPAPSTFFEGIHKLPPGSFLTINADGRRLESRYWDVLEHAEPLTGLSEEAIADRLLSELRTSVALRAVSDVPVGVFLSGGVDSSINAALFSEHASDPVKTFSVGYDANYRDCPSEFPQAREFAAHIGTVHQERILTQQDFLDFLPRMVYLQDEPIADPVCAPVFFLSKLARENGVAVAQAGEGADELFWGYARWRRMRTLIRLNGLPIPSAAKRLALLPLRAGGLSRSPAYELLWRAGQRLPVFWGGVDALPQRVKLDVLSPRLRRRFQNESSWEAIRPIHERFLQNAWEKTPVKWMTYLDLSLRLPELLLMRLDKMGMGASLETRVPYLDHKFVQFAMSIPENVLTRGNRSKHILKSAARGVIPDSIIDRPKQGFGVPIRDWFGQQFGEFARRELLEFCAKTDFLDGAAVSEVIRSGRAWQAWFLLNFALWWKEFIENRNSSTAKSTEFLAASR